MKLKERILDLIVNGTSKEDLKNMIEVERIYCGECANVWVQVYLLGDKVKCPACKALSEPIKI